MEPEIERRLVRRFKAGDESAFDLVYEAYRHRLFAFLYRMTRNRDTAEDLLEETWVRVTRRIDTLRDETRLRAWLFAVARRQFLSHRRVLASSLAVVGDVDLHADVADPGPSPFEVAAAGEMSRRLERGLAALPTSYREVLILVGVHGLTPSEAAEVCEVTPEALRQRLLRARAQLAQSLQDEDSAGRPADTKDGHRGRRTVR